MFIGACLLLADISTVLALTESVVKQGASTKDLHSNSTDEPKSKCYFFPSMGLKMCGTLTR